MKQGANLRSPFPHWAGKPGNANSEPYSRKPNWMGNVPFVDFPACCWLWGYTQPLQCFSSHLVRVSNPKSGHMSISQKSLPIMSQLLNYFEVPDCVSPPKPIAKERGQQKVSPVSERGGEEEESSGSKEVIGVGGRLDMWIGALRRNTILSTWDWHLRHCLMLLRYSCLYSRYRI